MRKRGSSNRGAFARALWAYKGDDKPKKAKVTPITSGYDGVKTGSFSTDFGSGQSSLVGEGANKRFETTAMLSPELAGVAGTAGRTLQGNLQYLQTDPAERVAAMQAGEVPIYNVMAEQADRARAEAVGRQQVDAQTGGLTNSTTMGSALGRIANDDILRRNQILQAALEFGNQSARADAQLGLGSLTGLNSLVTPYGAAAASQLQTARGSQDAAAAATAQARNQAEMNYVSSMNSYNANQPGVDWGSVGGLAGGAAALIAAPFTAGASLAYLPLAMGGGAALGGVANSFTGSSGGTAGPYGGGGGGGGYTPYLPPGGQSYFGGFQPSGYSYSPTMANTPESYLYSQGVM